MKLSTEELIAEEKRARALADLCFVHGQVDGGKAMRSIADAIAQETAERSRGKVED